MGAITDLPEELLAVIATRLQNGDLMSLRLTCRPIEKASFDHFARRFFRKMGFMITTESLQVLGAISRHNGLKAYVQHIWFNPDCFTFVMNSGQLISKSSMAIAHYHDDHRDLLNSSTLPRLMEESIRALPSLKTIGMRRGGGYKPWGWWKAQLAAGQDPRLLGSAVKKYPHMFLEPSLLFVAIVKALASCETAIRRLYTDSVLEPVVTQHVSVATLHAACASIYYLEINLLGALPAFMPNVMSSITLPPASGTLLRDLLKSTPDLREIGMTLYTDSMQRHMMGAIANDLESWHNTYPFRTLKSVSEDIELANLRRVKLEQLWTTANILISILTPSCSNLISLKLRHIHLLSESQEGKQDSNESEHYSAWQQIFHLLANECSDLEYVLLHWLSLDGTTVRFQHESTSVTIGLTGFNELPDYDNFNVPLVGREPYFVDYDNLTVEVFGRVAVHERMLELVHGHYHGTKLMTYAMDEDVWHTDTSEEEW